MSLGQPSEHLKSSSSNIQRAAPSFHYLLNFFQAVPGIVELTVTEGGRHYPYHTAYSLPWRLKTLGQGCLRSNYRHSPSHQQKIGLKINWARYSPPKQGPVFPEASPSYQEACTDSYPHPSEGRQNENHNHRKLTKMITWTKALCNLMQLWAMPCRATQDRWVMVEGSNRTWSTGEGNGEPLQHFALRAPWTVWKGKKIWHWKMNPPHL